MLVCVLVVPAWAHAAPASQQPQLGRTVLVGGPAAPRREYQAWIDAARANVRQVRALVEFREAPCPGGVARQLSACVIVPPPGAGRARMYIPAELRNPALYVPLDLRNTVLHELGHIYDFGYNRDGHRGAFMRLFGIAGRFYDGGRSPAYERFAVAYSYCAERLTYELALTRIALDSYVHRFTAPQYQATCQMLAPIPTQPAQPVVGAKPIVVARTRSVQPPITPVVD